MTEPRARRPIPERIEPNRGILGVFGQNAWRGPSDTGHPLGPGFDDTVEPTGGLDFLDEHMQQASDLVDRHIADAGQEQAAQDNGILGNLAGIAASANAGDLTTIVASLTRTYADVATKWVDLASTLAQGLSQQATGPGSSADASGLGAAGPIISVRSSVPVEARIEMFRPAMNLQAQPLGAENPQIATRITNVKVEDGRLKLRVDAAQPPGVYYGLLLEDGVGPAGVVTVEVFEGEDP